MQVALSLQNPATIRAYFEKIVELRKTGDEYPVSLDDVWALAYSRKDAALRALGEIFVKGLDYQIFHQNVGNSARGRKQDIYKLSVSCLEYLVARKVRPVFEVYREVFHKAHETLTKVKEVVKPAIQELQRQLFLKDQEIAHLNKLIDLKDGRIKDAREMIEIHRIQGDKWYQYQQDTQSMATYYRDLYRQETEISKMLREKVMSLDAAKPASEAPAAGSALPELTTATKINRLVRNYIGDGGFDYKAIYNWIYTEMADRYHIAPLKWKIPTGSSRIAEVERRGHIEKMLVVAEHLLLPAQMVA